MRCLVLASAWDGEVVFVMRRGSIAPERVLAAGHRIDWIENDAPSRLAAHGARWAVIDHYELGAGYLELVAATGLRTLAIDDIATHAFPVDVLLNQNTDADARAYVTRDHTRRLLGPRYALVRDGYRRARPPRPVPRPLERIIVAFGGSDPEDRTAAVLEALVPLVHHVQVVAAIGPAYTGSATARHGMIIHRDRPDLIDAMRNSQLMIGAGGSTVWEACCLGLAMVLQPFADNQRGIVTSLAAAGAACDATGVDGPALAALIESLGPTELAALAGAAWDLVDGLGARRVVEVMQ